MLVHLKSSWPVDHKLNMRDVILNANHITDIKAAKFIENDVERYMILVGVGDEGFKECHPSEEILRKRLEYILSKITGAEEANDIAGSYQIMVPKKSKSDDVDDAKEQLKELLRSLAS